jgi:type I restriction enzyme, R subunit
MPGTSNFGFLEGHDVRLATFGAQAERYFRDDPPTAIVKLRQFAELLAKLIAAHHALYLGERETFDETLRRLSFERIVSKEAADIFHVCASSATPQSTTRRAVTPTRWRH